MGIMPRVARDSTLSALRAGFLLNADSRDYYVDPGLYRLFGVNSRVHWDFEFGRGRMVVLLGKSGSFRGLELDLCDRC